MMNTKRLTGWAVGLIVLILSATFLVRWFEPRTTSTIETHEVSRESSQRYGRLPNLALTPGDTLTSDTAIFCRSGYSRSVRKVTVANKTRAYRDYKVPDSMRVYYVIDHSIPLELGGANTLRNIFPQLKIYSIQKDSLENRLHRLVCTGKVSARVGQRNIAFNWYTYWLKIKLIR